MVVSQCSDGSVWCCHSVVTGVCGGVSQCSDRSVWWCHSVVTGVCGAVTV